MKQLVDNLEDTIREFLDKGCMFTAYDVTIATRTRENMNLRHENAREEIHRCELLNDAVEFGYVMPSGENVSWKRSQKAMPNGKWALVYHPETADPSEYEPITPKANQITPLKIVHLNNVADSSLIVDTSDSGGLNDDDSYSTDYRNRLLVPTRFLREAGFSPGDLVSVVKSSGSIKITAANGSGEQKVERNGDIRLSSTTLGEAGFLSNKFSIKTDQGSVLIEEIT